MQLQQNDLATDSPFEAGRASPRPARAFPKKKNPVTLIVGIICKEEMIIATDSRTTFASHVEDHAKKIRVIDYRHGKVLVAWSGFTAFAIDAVDIFEQRCEKFEPKDYRALAELAKKVVDEIRVREISVLRETKSSPESIQNYLRDNSEFVLMLAYYVHSEPCLYTLNFPMGAIERTQYHFATLGNNASLGSYLLKEYSQSDMGAELATALAVYVIESVGEHDKYVGGETRVAVTRN